MNWRYLIPATFLLFTCLGEAEAQELPLTHYTTDSELNPLPSALVTQVYQDQQGFIWFTVFSSGLIRYDGSRMILYDQTDGLNDLGIWEITEDHSGHLWVASHGGLVVSEEPITAYTNGRRITFTNVFDGVTLWDGALSQGQIAVDAAGVLWVGTENNGLIRYHINEERKLQKDSFSTNLSGSELLAVSTLSTSHDGSILAGLSGGKLVQFSGDTIIPIHISPEASKNQDFVSLYEDNSGKIWAYKRNGELFLFSHPNASPFLISRQEPSNITGITAPADSTVWVSNSTSGIVRFEQKTGKKITSYSRANGLLSDNIFHVFEDREGNVWIAQSGGVSKLRYNFHAFKNYSARSMGGAKPALPSSKVNTVLIPQSDLDPCSMWVGTEGGAACLNDDGFSEFITQDEGLAGNWVNGLAADPDGTIWIATTQGLSAISFENKELIKETRDVQPISVFGSKATIFTIVDSPPFIAAENLRIMHSQANSPVRSVWFAGLRSLYGVVEGQIYTFDSRHGLPSTLYKAVAFDNENHLWIGTLDDGIYRSRNEVTIDNLKEAIKSDPDSLFFEQIWSRELGAPTNHIEKFLWLRDTMWVGTQEGLFALNSKGEMKLHINQSKGLPANNAVSFAASPLTGHLWVGTNKGLTEVNPTNGKVLKTVTRQNGLIDNEVWLYGSVQIDSSGKIYYGTSQGLSIYDSPKDRPNNVPPLLQLTSAEISYQSEGRNEATFEYAALSFSNTSGIRYSTRLLGYDEKWSANTAENKLRYTNLSAFWSPKEYTLEVTATNENGVEAEQPVRYAFFVDPVWWMQWWAFLIYLGIFVSGVVVVDRIQRKRLIKKEREMARLREAELQAETATARSNAAEAQAKALRTENEKKVLELKKARELEKAYHELKATQNQLIQAEKMASLGRLAAGIAHEIKNPLNFINNFAEISKELVDELLEAIHSGDEGEVKFLMSNLKHNTGKIEEHGKRADGIVRSMMQHARGVKTGYELTDLNATVKEYTDLAYHGKRAQNPDFYTKITTQFDPAITKVMMGKSEIGQVLLNIIGNSLDAVWAFKKSENGNSYEPEIVIKTSRNGNSVEISIADNGPGIPSNIREKIFEPFFTTKPAGEGTGLGLSLSYDIITQGHNGLLRLENRNGSGAEFIITLPNNGQ